MEAKAIAKYVRMSPSKLKPVTDLVRGKDLNEALTILKFTPGKGAEIVEKVVASAAANAENNFDLIGFVFQLVMLAIMAYYRFTSDTEDPAHDGMLNCYFLSLIALLFTPVLTQVLRVSQCFGYCQILLIPRTINSEKNPTRRMILYTLIVGLYVTKLLYDTYHLGWNGVIPYQTIFG